MTAHHAHRVTWLGHATVLIETGGARLLTDPVLSDRVMHLKRQVPTPVHPGPLDAVLISHLHHDHLHRPSLRGLSAEAVAPVGATRYLPAGYRVQEVRAGDTVDVGVTTEIGTLLRIKSETLRARCPACGEMHQWKVREATLPRAA